jgi:hypothetical protein
VVFCGRLRTRKHGPGAMAISAVGVDPSCAGPTVITMPAATKLRSSECRGGWEGRRDHDIHRSPAARHPDGGPRGAVRADEPATGHGVSVLAEHLWFKQSPRAADYF